jgi:hypothetical protein
MDIQLRRAVPGDEQAFISIKRQLPLVMADGGTTSGGFLLGTDVATYREYIDDSYCLVAECHGAVVGFGIMFPDMVLRTSDIWVRRHSASWYIDLARYENQQLCYFEQFAFLRGHRRSAVALAYNLVKWGFDSGATTLFTTTVNKPILNLAPLPFIRAVAGVHAGNIDEVYPMVGHINSDIYMVDGSTYFERVSAHPLYSFLVANTLNDL